MKITSHFNVGEKAYHITRYYKSIFVDCLSCERGRVHLKSGNTIECPSCKGSGALVDRQASVWTVNREMTIGQIRIEVDADNFEEKYMCEETGVGSGSIHSILELYKTKDLAQQECDRRNNSSSVEWACTRCNEDLGDRVDWSSREWRHCVIHENTIHVDRAKAQAKLDEQKALKDAGELS